MAAPVRAAEGRTHLAQLDILRGIAVLAVFLVHYTSAVFALDQLPWNGLLLDYRAAPSKLYFLLFPMTLGWMGVPLFFVLSGFVIQLSFLQSPRFDTLSFYWRRFWRIYPSYLLALIVFTLANHVDPLHWEGFFQIISHVFLIHNFSQLTFFGISDPFWSLGVEVHFYLLFPLVIWLRNRYGMYKTLLTIFAISTISTIGTLIQQQWYGTVIPPVWNTTLSDWFDWMLGVYVAEQYVKGQRAFRFSPMVLIGLIVLVFGSTQVRPLAYLSFHFSAFLLAVFVDYCVHQRPDFGRIGKLLGLLGLCSYSMYLWHSPLLYWLNGLLHTLGLPNNYWFDLTIAPVFVLAVTIPLSWLLYITVERWSTHMGRSLALIQHTAHTKP